MLIFSLGLLLIAAIAATLFEELVSVDDGDAVTASPSFAGNFERSIEARALESGGGSDLEGSDFFNFEEAGGTNGTLVGWLSGMLFALVAGLVLTLLGRRACEGIFNKVFAESVDVGAGSGGFVDEVTVEETAFEGAAFEGAALEGIGFARGSGEAAGVSFACWAKRIEPEKKRRLKTSKK